MLTCQVSSYLLFIFACSRACILVQVTINRGPRIGRDNHPDQFEACGISQLVREYGPRSVFICRSLLAFSFRCNRWSACDSQYRAYF